MIAFLTIIFFRGWRGQRIDETLFDIQMPLPERCLFAQGIIRVRCEYKLQKPSLETGKRINTGKQGKRDGYGLNNY